MTATRLAPATGYDFGPKRQYRRDIWSFFRRWTGVRTKDAWAMLMPSSEGDEMDVALSKGFREDRLVMLDQNVAIMASLKARRFPRAIAKGGLVGDPDLGQRLRRAGVPRLHLVNCDFTQTVGAVVPQLRALADSGILAPAALVAVTVLKGRESKPVFEEVQKAETAMKQWVSCRPDIVTQMRALAAETGSTSNINSEAEQARAEIFATSKRSGRVTLLGMALSAGTPIAKLTYNDPLVQSLTESWALPRLAMVSNVGEYRSGTKHMLWTIFKVHAQPCICDSCLTNHLWFARPDQLPTWFDHYFRAVGLGTRESRERLWKERHQHLGFQTLSHHAAHMDRSTP